MDTKEMKDREERECQVFRFNFSCEDRANIDVSMEIYRVLRTNLVLMTEEATKYTNCA